MENAPLTPREIAQILEVSPERVRQVENALMRKF